MGLLVRHVLACGLSLLRAANVRVSAGRHALHIGSFFRFLVAITLVFVISKLKYHLSIIAILHVPTSRPVLR